MTVTTNTGLYQMLFQTKSQKTQKQKQNLKKTNIYHQQKVIQYC